MENGSPFDPFSPQQDPNQRGLKDSIAELFAQKGRIEDIALRSMPLTDLQDMLSERYGSGLTDRSGNPVRVLSQSEADALHGQAANAPGSSSFGNQEMDEFRAMGINDAIKFDNPDQAMGRIVQGEKYAVWKKGAKDAVPMVWNPEMGRFQAPGMPTRRGTAREIEAAQYSEDARIMLEKSGIDVGMSDGSSFASPNEVYAVAPLDSALSVGGKAALRSIPTTAAALGGFTAGASAGARIPMVGTVAAPVLGITGGAVAAAAAEFGMNGILDSLGLGMTEKERLSALGNPEANFVGGQLPQLLVSSPLYGPKSWSKEIGGMSGPNLKSRFMSGAEEIGEGIGERVGQQGIEKARGNDFDWGQVFDPGTMAVEGGMGAVMSEMTGLGQVIGGTGHRIGMIGSKPVINRPVGVTQTTGSSINMGGTSLADIVAGNYPGSPTQQQAQPIPQTQQPPVQLSRNNQNSLTPPLVPYPPTNLGEAAMGAGDNNAAEPYRHMGDEQFKGSVVPPSLRRAGSATVARMDNGVQFAQTNRVGLNMDSAPGVAEINVETALPSEPTTQNLPLQGQLSYHRNLMGESGGDRGIIPFTVDFIRSHGLEPGQIDNEAVGYWRDPDTQTLERNPATQFTVVLPRGAVDKGRIIGDIRAKLDSVAAGAATVGGQKGASWIVPVNGDQNPNGYNSGVQITGKNFPRLDVYGVKAISEAISAIIKSERNIPGNVDIGVMNMPNGLRFIDFTGNWSGDTPGRTVYKDANGKDVVFGADYLADVVARAYDQTIGKHYGVDADVHLFNFDSNYFEAGGGMIAESDRLTPRRNKDEIGPYGQGYATGLGKLSGEQRGRLDSAIAEANATRRALAGNADPGFEGLRYDANGIPFRPDLGRVNATNLRTDETGRVAGPARPALRREANIPPSSQLGQPGGEIQGRTVRETDTEQVPLPPQTTYEQDAQTQTKLTPASTGGMERPSTSTVERERDTRLAQRAAQDIVGDRATNAANESRGMDDVRKVTSKYETEILQELRLRADATPMSATVNGRDGLYLTTPDNPHGATSDRAGKVLGDIGSQTGEKLSFRVVLRDGGLNNSVTDNISDTLLVQVVNEDGTVISQSTSSTSIMGGQPQVHGGRLDTVNAYKRKDLAFAAKAEALNRISQALKNAAFTGYMRLKMSDVSEGSASTKVNLRAAEPGLKNGRATMSTNQTGGKTDTAARLIEQINAANLMRKQYEAAIEASEAAQDLYFKNNRGKISQSEMERGLDEIKNRFDRQISFYSQSYSDMKSSGMTGELRIGEQYSQEQQPMQPGSEKDAAEAALLGKIEHAQKMMDRIEALRGTPRFDMMGGQKTIDGLKSNMDTLVKQLADINGVDLEAHAKEVEQSLAQQQSQTQSVQEQTQENQGVQQAQGGSIQNLDKNAEQSLGDERKRMRDDFEQDSGMLDDSGRRLAGKIINGTDVRGALEELAKGKDMHARLAKMLLKLARPEYLAKTVEAYRQDKPGVLGHYTAGGGVDVAGPASKGDTHTTLGTVRVTYEALMTPEGVGDSSSARSVVMHEIVHAVISDAVNRALHGRVATLNSLGSDVMGVTGKSYLDKLRAYVKSNSSSKDEGVSRIVQAYLKYYSTLPQNVRDMYESGAGGDSTGGDGHSRLMSAGAQYGAVSVNEFMSEALSNKDFAETLRAIPMGKTNMFSVFKSAVAKVLGIKTDADANLLSEVIDAGLQTASTRLGDIAKPGRAFNKALVDVKTERFIAENKQQGGFQIGEPAQRFIAGEEVNAQRKAAQHAQLSEADIQADLDRARSELSSSTDPNQKRVLGNEVLRLESELLKQQKDAMDRLASTHTPEQMAELRDMASKRGIDNPTADQLNQLARIKEQQDSLSMPSQSDVMAVRKRMNEAERVAEAKRRKRLRDMRLNDAEQASQAEELALENENADTTLPGQDTGKTKGEAEAERLRQSGVEPHTPENTAGTEGETPEQRIEDERKDDDEDNQSPDGWSINDVLHPDTRGMSRNEQRSLSEDIRSGRFLKREVLDSKRRVQALAEVIRRGKMTPKEAAKWGARTLMDVVTMKFIASNQAELLTMADRTGSKAALEIFRMLNGGVPGRMEDPAVGQAYHSAVSTRAMQFKNSLSDAVKPFESELKDMDRGQQRAFFEEVGRLVSAGSRDADGNWVPSTPADPKMAKLVTDIRSLYREMHAYQVRAGIELGNWGGTYIPRMLNNEAVIKNRDEFIQAATEAYKTTGMSDFEAGRAAMHWYDAVLRGDSGFTYGSDFIFDGATLNGEPKHTRDRVFGPEAEAILDKFYNRNILDATNAYVNRAVRNAEVSRRFGADFAKYRDLQNKFIEEGNSEKLRQLNDLVASQLGATTAGNATDSALLHFMQTYSAVHFLPRATFSSLSEPAILAVRTGNVMDAFVAYKDSATQFLRQLVHASPDYHTKLAEDLGVVLGHLADSATASSIESRYFSEHSRRGGSWVANQFFRRTGLAQWTEGTRVAAVKMGETFLNRLANDVLDGNATEMSSKKFLKELGITDVQGFSQFVKDLNAGKSKRDDVRRQAIMAKNGKHAEAYRQALVRFAEQTIMNPNAGTRPRWANHPLGGVIFNLQSYLYAFHENVTKRTVRLASAAVDPRSNATIQDRMRMAAPIGILAASSIIQYLLGELRKKAFNDPARRFNPEDSEPTKWGRAVSRANIIGRYDFVMNALLGLKYDKEPATVMAGPVLGAFSEAFKSLADNMSASNSPNTNTAERKAARMGYDLLAQPAMNAAFSVIPGGWMGGAIGAAGIQASSHPGTREAFVEDVAGPPVNPKKRPNTSSFWDDVMPE